MTNGQNYGLCSKTIWKKHPLPRSWSWLRASHPDRAPCMYIKWGMGFFRFDEQESVTLDNVCNVLVPNKANALLYSERRISYILAVWWPLFQIFCFFKYSRFSCVSTWTVLTNGSKLIRSDWFSSNIYLLVLGPIVPFCSISAYPQQFFYFMVHPQQTQSCHKVCVLHQCVYDLCLC